MMNEELPDFRPCIVSTYHLVKPRLNNPIFKLDTISTVSDCFDFPAFSFLTHGILLS